MPKIDGMARHGHGMPCMCMHITCIESVGFKNFITFSAHFEYFPVIFFIKNKLYKHTIYSYYLSDINKVLSLDDFIELSSFSTF